MMIDADARCFLELCLNFTSARLLVAMVGFVDVVIAAHVLCNGRPIPPFAVFLTLLVFVIIEFGKKMNGKNELLLHLTQKIRIKPFASCVQLCDNN